jgi:hypothetical protein
MIVYPQNEHSIHSSDEYLRFEKDINEIIEFFELLSELIFENGYVMSYLSINGNFTLGTELLDSSIKTLKNAKYCCSNGSFSDANILIRKFRDDLTLFLYLLEIINTRIPYKDMHLMDLLLTDKLMLNDLLIFCQTIVLTLHLMMMKNVWKHGSQIPLTNYHGRFVKNYLLRITLTDLNRILK